MNSRLNKTIISVFLIGLFLSLLSPRFPADFHFVRASEALFSDGFESNDFDDGQWDVNGKWDTVVNEKNAHSGKIRAQVKGNTSKEGDILLKQIATSGLGDVSALTLSYWYKIDKQLESNDRVLVQWSIDNENWNQLADYTDLEEGEWTEATHVLPPEASNEDEFQFRFLAILNAGNDVFWLDDVVLGGDAAPVGNFKKALVKGKKINDINGDGVVQENEPPLSDWKISLISSTGQVVAETSTDDNGIFEFTLEEGGDFLLSEEVKSGWAKTLPSSSAFDIQVSSGQTIESDQNGNPLIFANHELTKISEEFIVNAAFNFVTVVWQTDKPATSRIIFDVISHEPLGGGLCPPPSEIFECYGYANSTSHFDLDPKVISHSATIGNLSPLATYFFRTVSGASPETVSPEMSFSTPAVSGIGGGGGGGNSGSGAGSSGGGGASSSLAAAEPPPSSQGQGQSEQSSVFVAQPAGGQTMSQAPQIAAGQTVQSPLSQDSEVPASQPLAQAPILVTEQQLNQTTSAPAAKTANLSLLASLGNILSLGTGKLYVKIIALAVIAFGLFYLVKYWFIKK